MKTKPTTATLALRRQKRTQRRSATSRAFFAKSYLQLCRDIESALGGYALGGGSLPMRVAALKTKHDLLRQQVTDFLNKPVVTAVSSNFNIEARAKGDAI